MTRNYTILFFTLFIIYSQLCFSQTKKQKAELYKQFQADSVRIATPKFIRPQFRADTRVSLFDGKKININGYDAGVLLKNKLRLALGYYMIDKDYKKEVDGVDMQNSLKVKCGSLNTEMIYFDSRFLAMGFPLELSFGQYHFSRTTVAENSTIIDQSGIMAFANFGLSGTFKPIRWLGLKGIAGYRKSLVPNVKDLDFNAPFTSIGLNIDMQEIIKDIRMYRLKKNYNKNIKRAETFIDLITD